MYERFSLELDKKQIEKELYVNGSSITGFKRYK